MVDIPRQGEIWWAEVEHMRRPVLIISRSEAIAFLNAVVVAPVTRTVRAIPTEISLGAEEGLDEVCAASFDNIQRVHRAALTTRIGDLGIRRSKVCDAIRALTDC